MRISAWTMPVLTLIAAAFGYRLRLSEIANVFDPITNLPERNAETTMWLITLSLVYMLLIVVFAIITSVKHKALPGFENAFGTDPLAYPILFVLVGIVWIVGTFIYFITLNAHSDLTAIDVYFIIFSVISAISVALFAVEMYQDSRRKAPYALSIVPAIFMCFWLILMYKQNASNPILLSYVYLCLAIVASASSFYFTAGFLYGKPTPGKAIVTYYAAVFFCAVTLADDHPSGIKLIFCALIVVNVIYSSLLLRNLQKRKLYL